MIGIRAFLTIGNFDLAFSRLVTASNWQYKRFYRHQFAAYDISRRDNLKHLIADIRSNAYQPSPATLVYYPKSSGVLRPLALLTVRDLIVYQALLNIVAIRFESVQAKLKDVKTFGAIYSGKTDIFFYRNWNGHIHRSTTQRKMLFSMGSITTPNSI